MTFAPVDCSFSVLKCLLIFSSRKIVWFLGGSQFNTMSSGHGSVSSPQGFNTLGSNQSYRTEQHQKYHTMSSSGSHDGFGTMGSQNFGTMSSGHGYNTMGSQQNGSLHVDTTNRSMHSGPSSAGR